MGRAPVALMGLFRERLVHHKCSDGIEFGLPKTSTGKVRGFVLRTRMGRTRRAIGPA
jgi:hypothetical protein